MTRRQKQTLALLMPVTLVLVVLLGAGLAQPVPEILASPNSPQFDDQSFETNLVAWVKSIEAVAPDTTHIRSTIIQRLAQTTLPVETRAFSTTVTAPAQTKMQIWVTSPGTTSQTILMSANYAAMPNQTFVEQMRGVATVIELAKIFAAQPHHHTFVFLVSDSLLGFEPLAPTEPTQLRAVIDLTHLPFTKNWLDTRGLYMGYSPLWLREAAHRASQKTGASLRDENGLPEFFYRALPFQIGRVAVHLGLGIPAVQLNAFNGSAIETLIRTLDAFDPLPTDSVNAPYWRVTETHYLPNWATPLLQLLLFAPLLVFTLIVYRQDRPREEELRPEFTAFMAWVVVGLDGYAIAFSLVAARLLPQYELFPAAPGDAFLLQPTWWAALAIYGTMAVMFWYTFRGWRGSGGWGRFADMLTIPHRQTTLLILLSGLALMTWFVNGFAAVIVFGLPAYLWPWIEPRRTRPGKLLNTALALTGLLPLIWGLALVFGDPAFGPWWWFFPMGAAYGFFPFTTVVGFISFVALFIRFLRHGWR